MLPTPPPGASVPKAGAPVVHPSAKCCWCGSLLRFAAASWWCPTQACALRQLKYATYRKEKGRKGVADYLYVPSPRQTEWHEAIYDPRWRRLLFGGAAGPGKSRMLREALYLLARQVPGLHALLLRRTFKDLEQSHLRFMPYELEQRGAGWKNTERLAYFLHDNGPPSLIRCGHMETDADVQNYLSTEYDVIVPDELVTFGQDAMLELFARARTTNPAMIALRGSVAEDYDGALVVSASNPGGRGGAWVKDFFIDHAPDPEEFPDYLPEQWGFFPAYLRDNPYIKIAGYTQSLGALRDSRKRQLLDGDWTVFEGQFFEEFRPTRHLVDCGQIGPDCTRFLSMDWGWNAPGVVLWWVVLPDGHYHIEDEYKFNGEIGQKVTVQAVATHLHTRCLEKGLPHVPVCWTDPACWQHTGQIGESIAETFLRYRIPVAKANNDRVNGWQRVHELFRTAPDGRPWLTVGPRCVYLLRTLPTQLQSKTNPDDMDTTGDDHACDALRYGGVSGAGAASKGTRSFAPWSMGWWRAQSPDTHKSRLGSESVK